MKTKRHIQTLVFTLLLFLAGGMVNSVSAVKYHILTKPFDVANYNGSNKQWRDNIRVEALLCESNEATIGLPDQFKSPLAKNFRYWANTTSSTYASLYDYGHGTKIINVKYNIYQCGTDESVEGWQYACLSNELIAGDPIDSYTDIYVTYDYINDDEDEGYKNNILELDGATDYNIAFTNNKVEKFMCYNRSRNNRVANALGTALSGEHLASDEFVIPTNDNKQLGWNWSKWGPHGLFAGFMFTGKDPYNITIMTSYKGNELHITDKITNVDNGGTIKPYAGSSLMAKIDATAMWFDASNHKHYKILSGCSSEKDWTDEKYAELHTLYWSKTAAEQAEDWVGFYRYESPTLSTFALLPNNKGGYMFVGSKLNQNNEQKQPSDGKYYTYNDNYDNDGGGRSQPYFKLQSLSSAYPTNFYEIKTYRVHVKTHGSKTTLSTDMKWSDAKKTENPADHVPEALRRKYVTYKAYSDAALTNEITAFSQVINKEYWLDYTVSETMPFEVLPEDGSYEDARWYTMRMDGVTNPKYIAYDDDSNNLVVTNGSGAAKGSNTASQIHQGENSAEAMVAFMGDPYELKIISRKASETARANRYIGCDTGSTLETTGLTTNKTGSSDISTWEIVYESTGETGMLLRQFNTVSSPKYIGLGSDANNKPVTYSATASRIRVVELDKKKYAFHIMRIDGTMAVMATTSEDVGKALKCDYTDIPEIIRSPYLSATYTATVNYYATQEDAAANNDPSKEITNLPYEGSATGTYANIYVRYSYTSAPGATTYNVRINNNYIYTDGEAIKTKTQLEGDDATNGHFVWTFNFSDPYALTINNTGIDGDAKYVTVSQSDGASIAWSSTPTLFIAKSGNNPGTYEVMLATGDNTDASTEYYNIGRPEVNTVKLYKNSSYLSGNQTLRFQLSATDAVDVTYNLVDMYNNELLQAKTRQNTTEDLPAFPPEYYSPLVKKYYYHKTLAHAQANRTTSNYAENEKVGQNEVWVTYDVNDLIDLKAGTLYLLKYEAGEEFYQEDGSDGRTTEKQKAVYPYVNGDGNFFVYGEEQYELQQQGASSTRTRWAWYVESNVPGATKGDPYHVTIKSRQTEQYPIVNYSEYNAYFMTYQPDGYNEVITTLGWPGMNSETATEYMVLGSEGQYQLVTTNEIGGSRYVVDSFEQYWKTYDTIRRKLLNQSKTGYPDADDDKITVQSTPCLVEGFSDNRTYLTTSTENGGLGFHSYEKWAYAKRWNGFNNGYSSEVGKHEAKKGWEKIEHWYQTIDMGQGYFDFVETSITPVLILLDQHGWEIMRKPLPTDPDDPQKEVKYAEIRPYNSPMVKEYAFWSTAKKRTGFHQYYQLKDRIGDNFTSTDLTNLPPYGSKNVKDKKGNLNDQYVTYIVKEEYAQTYNPADKSAKPFLIEQGIDHKYATTNATGTTLNASNIPNDGNMKAYILNGNIQDTEKWYLKPNVHIDGEMGYNDATVPHYWDTDKRNAYEDDAYKNNRIAKYITDKDLGQFSFSNGFDPYNIQIQSAGVTSTTKFMKTDANGAVLNEGSIIGEYPAIPGSTVAMGDSTTIINPKPKWYDSRNLYVTNATFMAVQDAAGNMQLMPRFDHATRMSEFGTLIAPTSDDVEKTYTKLYRPEVYEYLIIDNDGKESLRYKSGGDMMPQTPNHFQSPLATNFTYYSSATYDSGTKTYSDITGEIEESLDGATLTDNKIYVRYEYNEEADDLNMLKGNWLTMQLNEKNAKYDSGIKQGSSKPATIDADDEEWQWKFLETPQSTPDPYALYIYNRSQSAGTEAIYDRFALFSHTSGGYALAKAGREDYTYQFLDGSGMDTSTDATVATEENFKSTSGTFDGTKSQVILSDEVQHTFTYKVYTNGGVNAIDATQTQDDVISNDWKPVLPEAARTPLLNIDQYRYYEQSLSGAVAENDTLNKSLSYLYGLYDDIVYTHYTAYDPNASSYVVPNVRNATNVNPVARGVGSNDAPIGLDGKRPYNIYWYQDEIMKSNGTSITSESNMEIQSTAPYEWEFEGDDPYAIKIKSVGSSGNYIHEATTTTTNLDASATTFMLLNKSGYDYGVFAKTGDKNTMLSGHGNELTTSDPVKFIPFALSTYKVIYHLMIKNIGSEGIIIPYKGEETNNELVLRYKVKDGTTLRDLTSNNDVAGAINGDRYQLGASLKAIQTETSGLFTRDSIYCYDAGHISLGDAFEVPQAFYRPNVSYDYYIEGVYSANGKSEIDAMNLEYKGLKMTNLGEDSRLLGNIVFVNIVYNFMGGLDTNSGSDFVESVSQNKWYTFETSGVTPMLAQYTGSLQTVSGYATHYTNDYLWTPVGDPYGFKMYNRYLSKNLDEKMVMSTDVFATDEPIKMVADNTSTPYVPHAPANSVYELLAVNTTTSGYFRIHPVVNMKDATQYYMRNVVSDGSGVIKLNTAPTEWTFGLSEEVMKPYYQAAGYIGGLNDAGKAAYDTEAAKTNPLERLMGIQDVVYNHDNDNSNPENPNYIVHYTPGYYRLHSQPGSSGITTPRYMSGYTHKTELDPNGDDSEADAIPMHFYEVEEYEVNNPTFRDLGTANTDYTSTPATRGDIPLVTVDEDPASIFQFIGETTTGVKLSTQGLYVKENKMTATVGNATQFDIVDIGAGVVALQQNGGDNFLKYAQNTHKYDLKFDNTASTVESARWCIKPTQKTTTAGNGEMALTVTTKNGGDEHYYTTFYAPFDVLLTSTNDIVYVVPSGKWPAMTTAKNLYVMHPKRIGEFNTEANGCPEAYRGSNQFIPANTPVIIRTKNTGGEVNMALPNTSSTPITTSLSGEYLEQMLAQDADEYVFVLGRSYTHSGDFTYNSSTGEVTPAGLEFDKGVGFYQNANTNRESNETKTQWTRNNKYVYANKVYYRGAIETSGSSLNVDFEKIDYIPVLFDNQGVEDMDLQPDGTMRLTTSDGRAYDMQGRCVATEQEVSDGSWLNNVASGMYIVNGKKFVIE